MFPYSTINPLTLIAAAASVASPLPGSTAGVLVAPSRSGTGILIAATDGAFLIEYTYTSERMPASWIPSKPVVIHAKTLPNIIRLCRAHHRAWRLRPQSLTLAWGDTYGVVSTGDGETHTLHYWEGPYPKYHYVFAPEPSPSPVRMALSTKYLAAIHDLLAWRGSANGVIPEPVLIGGRAPAMRLRPMSTPAGLSVRGLVMGISLPELRSGAHVPLGGVKAPVEEVAQEEVAVQA